MQAFCKQSEDNYFYDKEFDNASWRVSQIGPVESATERPCKRLKPSELTMGDVFSGLGTVALASLSAGMQVPSVILPCRSASLGSRFAGRTR